MSKFMLSSKVDDEKDLKQSNRIHCKYSVNFDAEQ